MSEEQQATIEDHVIKVTAKQAGRYMWGIAVICFFGASAYFGISSKLDRMSDQIVNSNTTVSQMKSDVKDLKKESDDRYWDLKTALDKKQDKK